MKGVLVKNWPNNNLRVGISEKFYQPVKPFIAVVAVITFTPKIKFNQASIYYVNECQTDDNGSMK